MKPPAPRFGPEALRFLAGDRGFERGAAYFRDGQVTITSLDAHRVRARVRGTDDYRVTLTGRGADVDGTCDCPPADPLAAVRAWLAAQPNDALVALIVDLAEADPALLQRLDVAAARAGHGDPREVEASFKKAVDAATRRSRLPEYRGVGAWAASLEETLDAIEALADGPCAAAALRLAEHALGRFGDTLGLVDDSSGHVGALIVHAAEIHLTACRSVRPDPRALAGDLFARETAGGDAFHAAAETYADVLGEPGRAEYRRLAQEAWDELPPRGPRDARDEFHYEYDRLSRMLDRFAAADGDVAARVALRGKDLSSPWAYVRLAEFCREQGRPDEALARGEEGLWVFEDRRPDAGLLNLVADLLIEAGRPAEAEAHLWRAFAADPGEELYRRLRTLGGEPARDRALAALEARLATAQRDRWSSPADLLVRLLLSEGQLDRAWAIANAHGIGSGLACTLAEASEATHPREALAVHAERVRRLATAGGDASYAEAVAVLARMAKLQPPAEQAAFVADLRTRFARKRNLMRLLDA